MRNVSNDGGEREMVFSMKLPTLSLSVRRTFGKYLVMELVKIKRLSMQLTHFVSHVDDI